MCVVSICIIMYLSLYIYNYISFILHICISLYIDMLAANSAPHFWWISRTVLSHGPSWPHCLASRLRSPLCCRSPCLDTGASRWASSNEDRPRNGTRFRKKQNYFASSDPHHDISKQLVDTTFVWSFCHGTFAQLTIPIICFTWQVIVHVSLSNRI